MLVFKYLDEKDVFQNFYTKLLAKRLVLNLSSSSDAESGLIARLKELCGTEYTSKLQRMFMDMSTSKELSDAFKEQDTMDRTFDFTALVLCTGSWPLSPSTDTVQLPSAMQNQLAKFEYFYKNQHSGRTLHWLPQLSRGEIRATFKANGKTSRYILMVSAYQMAILDAMLEKDAMTIGALMERTHMLMEPCIHAVRPILQAGLFVCADQTPFQSSSLLSLNWAFSSKKVRVYLNIPLKMETGREVEETMKTVEEDRKIIIQAALVRIMKAQQKMKHVALVSQVLDQLSSRFKPKISDIKKCIDLLIDKEYLERAPQDLDSLCYVA